MLAGKEAKQVQWTNVYEDALVRPRAPTDGPTRPKFLKGPLVGVNQTENKTSLCLSPSSDHSGWGKLATGD